MGGLKELKWHRIKGARARECAAEAISIFVNEFVPRGARADILVWDILDSRHRVARRNDRKNFERMFFHLHRALMSRRPLDHEWHLRPDERLDVDWSTIRSCLDSVGGWRKYFESPLLGETISIASFRIASFKQTISHDTPLCQVADVLAGMGAYSRLKRGELRRWLEEQSSQETLFPRTAMALSGRERERFPLIKALYALSRKRGLGVSLESEGYLLTHDPRKPINFWHYTPQHGADKAPTD